MRGTVLSVKKFHWMRREDQIFVCVDFFFVVLTEIRFYRETFLYNWKRSVWGFLQEA